MIGYGGRFPGGFVQGEAQCKFENALRSIPRARHLFKYMTYRADEMMVRAGRFADGLKAADVEFFAGVPVISPCGCHRTDKGVCPTNCINELCQEGLII